MVGGGVIGCSIALKLARLGLTVAVIERGRVGGEASRAAAGMLSPQTEAFRPGSFLRPVPAQPLDVSKLRAASHRTFGR